jgi:hypothetical protein
MWRAALQLRASLSPEALQIFQFALNLRTLPPRFLASKQGETPDALVRDLLARASPAIVPGTDQSSTLEKAHSGRLGPTFFKRRE